jgi:hypothetical protein
VVDPLADKEELVFNPNNLSILPVAKDALPSK